MKRVYSSPDPLVTGLVKTSLEEAGISSEILGGDRSGLTWAVGWTESWLEVWIVEDAHEAQATAIVEEILSRGEATQPEDTESE
jgi:Putative prokaryotic signal transducing protein